MRCSSCGRATDPGEEMFWGMCFACNEIDDEIRAEVAREEAALDDEDVCPRCERSVSPGELEVFWGMCCACNEIDDEIRAEIAREEAPDDD